jgi:hypothetical protein
MVASGPVCAPRVKFGAYPANGGWGASLDTNYVGGTSARWRAASKCPCRVKISVP